MPFVPSNAEGEYKEERECFNLRILLSYTVHVILTNTVSSH